MYESFPDSIAEALGNMNCGVLDAHRDLAMRPRLPDGGAGVDSGTGRNDTLSIFHSPLVAFTGNSRAFDAERCENALLSGLTVRFYNIEDSILVDSEVTGDPAVTSSLADGLKDLGREPV